MVNSRILTTFAMILLTPACATSSAGDTTTLKEIMQGLRNDLVMISDGLLVDDFALIADGARGIAEHPKIPPDQVTLVAMELGAEMAAFKQLDTQVHDLAIQAQTAAEAANHDAAFRRYQEITASCLACHAAYKERVAGVLGATAMP